MGAVVGVSMLHISNMRIPARIAIATILPLLTFDEALAMSSLTIMTRKLLKIVRGQLFEQVEKAAVL